MICSLASVKRDVSEPGKPDIPRGSEHPVSVVAIRMSKIPFACLLSLRHGLFYSQFLKQACPALVNFPNLKPPNCTQTIALQGRGVSLERQSQILLPSCFPSKTTHCDCESGTARVNKKGDSLEKKEFDRSEMEVENLVS